MYSDHLPAEELNKTRADFSIGVPPRQDRSNLSFEKPYMTPLQSTPLTSDNRSSLTIKATPPNCHLRRDNSFQDNLAILFRPHSLSQPHPKVFGICYRLLLDLFLLRALLGNAEPGLYLQHQSHLPLIANCLAKDEIHAQRSPARILAKMENISISGNCIYECYESPPTMANER